MSRLVQGIKRRWSERHHYRSWRDFAWALYNRALIRVPWLPGRRRVYAFNISGVARPLAARLGTTDAHVMEEIFFHGEYRSLLDRAPEAIRQIVDLGANVGFSLRLWRMAFPQSRILAVEPDSGNLSVCRLNLKLDGVSDACTLVQACVAAHPGKVRLDRTGGDWGLRMTAAREEDDGELVEAMTMSQLLTAHDVAEIDLLKCDIEGAEKELFEDCRQWIGRVRYMVVELHHPYSRRDFESDLERNGGRFSTFHSSRQGNFEVLFLERDPPAAESLS